MRGLALGVLLGLASAAHASPPSDAELDALLARNPQTGRPVVDLAELVPLLSEELRHNFTFVYASRSPFAGSITPDHPRVILFSDDGTFVATFTGDASKPGHDVLETMRFDRQDARFVLRARALPAAGLAEGDVAELERTCTHCHGDDPRPIFDSYPLWPGFYGSAHDSFPDEVPSSRVEHAGYLRFLHGEAQHGVYRALRYIEGSPVTPFLDPLVFAHEDDRGAPDALRYQPNTRLGMALTELNRQRIARKLRASPSSAADARGQLSLLLGCDGGRLDAGPLVDAVRAENEARLRRLGVDPTVLKAHRFQMQELDHVDSLARLDRLARRAGVDRRDWSMALEPGSLAFYDGILSGDAHGHSYYLVEDLIFELLREEARRDPRLAPFFRARVSFPSLGYPFGTKLDLVRARRSCAALRGRGSRR